jgi:putative ABC transport system permease protein
VNAFNASEFEPWSWNSRTTVSGPGLDIDHDTVAALVTADPTAEPAVETVGEFDSWEVDIVGLEPDTAMIDRRVDAGRWLSGGREAVVSTGFAEHVGIAIGDDIDVRTATGTSTYRVVGFHRLQGRTLFVDVDTLAADLGRPGYANVVYSAEAATPPGLQGLTSTTHLVDAASDDSGRSAILLIFGAIGLVVVTVAGIAVASGLAVDVYERRHEFAAIRAIGGRSRQVMRVVSAELLPLATLGVVAGVGLGYLGGRAIMQSFERADAVDIGFVFAGGAVPAVAAVGGCLLIGGLTVRRVSRRSVAATLRSVS